MGSGRRSHARVAGLGCRRAVRTVRTELQLAAAVGASEAEFFVETDLGRYALRNMNVGPVEWMLFAGVIAAAELSEGLAFSLSGPAITTLGLETSASLAHLVGAEGLAVVTELGTQHLGHTSSDGVVLRRSR